ncbi:MAG: glutathione S-transferase N-terminal domain-containing protein [Sulfuricella sp.]|nr:glutathione S-transferase N-terminal domain-containing protein [Sulfuricella sp.]
MKWVVKIFFRSLRFVIGPFILFWEIVTTPKGIVRQPEEQRQVDLQCQGLILYQFRTCPFCIKVRREIRRLSLNIELRDAQKDQQNRAALLQGGGQIKVPCLKITDEQGNDQWMYESSEIIQYLHERFA